MFGLRLMFVLNGVLFVQAVPLNQFVFAHVFVSVPQYTPTAQADVPVLVSVPLNVAPPEVTPETARFWIPGGVLLPPTVATVP